MSKMTEEVILAIVKKFVVGTEGFKFIPQEDYKGYHVVFVFFEDGGYVGRPIFVLVDKDGKARYADPDEGREIMAANNTDDDDFEEGALVEDICSPFIEDSLPNEDDNDNNEDSTPLTSVLFQ